VPAGGPAPPWHRRLPAWGSAGTQRTGQRTEAGVRVIDQKLEAAARELYEANENRVKPDWDQLGDATKSVWRAYVQKDPNWPFKYSVAWKEPVAQNVETQLQVALLTAQPPEEPAVSGEGYARTTTEVPLTTWEPVEHKKPLTLKERLALKGIK